MPNTYFVNDEGKRFQEAFFVANFDPFGGMQFKVAITNNPLKVSINSTDGCSLNEGELQYISKEIYRQDILQNSNGEDLYISFDGADQDYAYTLNEITKQ